MRVIADIEFDIEFDIESMKFVVPSLPANPAA